MNLNRLLTLYWSRQRKTKDDNPNYQTHSQSHVLSCRGHHFPKFPQFSSANALWNGLRHLLTTSTKHVFISCVRQLPVPLRDRRERPTIRAFSFGKKFKRGNQRARFSLWASRAMPKTQLLLNGPLFSILCLRVLNIWIMVPKCSLPLCLTL